MRRARVARAPGYHGAARDEVLRFLDDTFATRNWGHLGLRRAIAGVGLAEAVWRPHAAGHSVWEQLNHVAHWARYTLERLQGKRPQAHQAWPAAGRTEAELRRMLETLTVLHNDLHKAVAALGAEEFAERKGGRYRIIQLLLGAAAHESYHIGQIVMTRKLYRRARGQRD